MKEERVGAVQKKTKRSTQIPWFAFCVAFLFIFNPNISIVDVLPDFLGYIILSAALVKISMISEGLAEARRAFEKMILIDASKLLVMIWVFGIESSNELSSSLLLWSFVFGALELIFLVPAFVKLFEGFGELGNFHKNTAIHGSKHEGKRSYTEKLRNLSVFFVIFRAVMTLLPELSDLTNVNNVQEANFVNIYRYIGVMRMFCFIPVLAVGIIWLIKSIRYFSRIKADRTFCESVEGAYREKIIPKEGLFVIRNVKIATWLFVAAMVLSLDIKFEGANVFPDLLILLFFIPAFIYMRKTTVFSRKSTIITSALFAVSSVASIVADQFFHNNYTYNSMEKNEESFFVYLIYVGAVALQGVVFICLLTSFSNDVRKVISAHTGYVVGAQITERREDERVLRFHKELGKSFSYMLDVAILYVISDIAKALYGAVYAFMDKNWGWLGLVNIICGILFIAMAVKAVSELREAVQTKYMLE